VVGAIKVHGDPFDGDDNECTEPTDDHSIQSENESKNDFHWTEWKAIHSSVPVERDSRGMIIFADCFLHEIYMCLPVFFDTRREIFPGFEPVFSVVDASDAVSHKETEGSEQSNDEYNDGEENVSKG